MMSELPCACVCLCEHVKKKQDAGVVQQALHTVRTEDIRAHARAQMLHPLRPPFDTSEEGFCVLPDDGGRGGGEEAAEVPYVRKSCSLHHKDHMLASESQRGGRARRGRTERKDYRRAEGGRVCMWISVSFMCQHENAGINGLLCTLLRNTLLLRTWEHVRVHVVTHCCLCVLLGRLPLWAFVYQICMAEYESASL